MPEKINTNVLGFACKLQSTRFFVQNDEKHFFA